MVQAKHKGIQAALLHFYKRENVPLELWQFQPCVLPAKLSSKTTAPFIGKSKERFDPDAGVGQAVTDATANTNEGRNDDMSEGASDSESDSSSIISSGSNADPPATKRTRFASEEREPAATRRVSHSTAKVPQSQRKLPADPPDKATRPEHGREREREREHRERRERDKSESPAERKRDGSGHRKRDESESHRDKQSSRHERRKRDKSESPAERKRDSSGHRKRAESESHRDKQSSRRHQSAPPQHRGRRERSKSEDPPRRSRGGRTTEATPDRGRERERDPHERRQRSKSESPSERRRDSGRSHTRSTRRRDRSSSERRNEERNSRRNSGRDSRRGESEESPLPRRRDREERRQRSNSNDSDFIEYVDARSDAESGRRAGRRTEVDDNRRSGHRRSGRSRSRSRSRSSSHASSSSDSDDHSVQSNRRRSSRHNEHSPYDSRRRERNSSREREEQRRRQRGSHHRRSRSRDRGRSRSRSREHGRGRSRSSSASSGCAYFRNSPTKRSSRDWLDRLEFSMTRRALDTGALLRSDDLDHRAATSANYEQWGAILTIRPSKRDRRNHYLKHSTRDLRTVPRHLVYLPLSLDSEFKSLFLQPPKLKKAKAWITKVSYRDAKQRQSSTSRSDPTFRDFAKIPEQTLEHFRNLNWHCGSNDEPSDDYFSAFSLLTLFTPDNKMYIPQKGLSHNEGMELIECLIYLLSRGVPDKHRQISHENPEIFIALRMVKHHASFGAHVSHLNSIQLAWDTDSTSRVCFTYLTLRCLDRILDAFHRLAGQTGALYKVYVETEDYHRERRKRQLVRVKYGKRNSPIVSYDNRDTVTLPQALEKISVSCNELLSSTVNPSVSMLPDVLREKGFKSIKKEKKEKGKTIKPERETLTVEFYKTAMFDFVGDFEPCRNIITAADDTPTVKINGRKSQVCLRACGKEFQGCSHYKGTGKNKCKFFHFPNDGSALDDKVDPAPFATWAKLPAVKKYIKPTDLGKKLLGIE